MTSKIDVSKLEPLYEKNCICPICSTSFTSKKIRTRFVKPWKVDTDYGPIFKQGDYNPLFYYITVCPECGFSFSEDFSVLSGEKIKQIVKKQITEKMDRHIDYRSARDFDQAVKTHKLAIYSAQVVGEKHIVFAKLCLRLAWLYRGIEDKVEENRFLQLATAEYEQSYIHSDFNPESMPEIAVLYMIGELNRKLGNYNEAVRYFATVVEHPDKSRYQKYTNLAREQWKSAVDEYRNMKQG